jgi:hypothetical protein
VLNSGTSKLNPTNFSKLSMKLVVYLSGMSNITFSVRQAWIVASLNCCRQPRMAVGGGVQNIWGSNQVDSDPRRFKLSF